MKYIIFKGYLCEEPVIFSKLQNHDDMASLLKGIGKPVSAGYIDYDDGGYISAHGRSSTLELESRPEDSEIIDRFMDSSH